MSVANLYRTLSDALQGGNTSRENSDPEYLCPNKEWNFEVVVGVPTYPATALPHISSLQALLYQSGSS
jgi:hypothetical protein